MNGYCQDCQHPHGYHGEGRGCAMPLGPSGLPLGRNESQASTCGCENVPPPVSKPCFRNGLVPDVCAQHDKDWVAGTTGCRLNPYPEVANHSDRITDLTNALWKASDEKLDIIEKVLDL